MCSSQMLFPFVSYSGCSADGTTYLSLEKPVSPHSLRLKWNYSYEETKQTSTAKKYLNEILFMFVKFADKDILSDVITEQKHKD